MGFLGRWFASTLSLGLGLVTAVLAMQVPALTHEYATALLQVARALDHDAVERIASARERYSIAATREDEVVDALRAVEPSNAETLAASRQRARRLQVDHDAIMAAGPLTQPLTALWQVLREESADRTILYRTLGETYDPQISLTLAAVVYGLAGLLLGTLFAQIMLSGFAGAVRLLAGRGGTRRAAG